MKPIKLAVLREQGRPTSWRKEYNQGIIDFFSRPKLQKLLKTVKTKILKDGLKEVQEEYMYLPNDMPTFSEFAWNIGVNEDSVVEWAKIENEKKYPGFSASYKRAHALQKAFLIDNASKGMCPPATFIFVAKNITDMRDEIKQDITSNGQQIVAFNYLPPPKDDAGSSTNDTTNN